MIHVTCSKDLNETLDDMKIFIESCKGQRFYTYLLCTKHALAKLELIQVKSRKLSIMYLLIWGLLSIYQLYINNSNTCLYIVMSLILIQMSEVNRRNVLKCNKAAIECREVAFLLYEELKNKFKDN